MNKRDWLAIAEVTDSLRVFPRLFLLGAFLWTVDSGYVILNFYMKLPAEARTLETSGAVFGMFTAILGFMKLVYDKYSDAGRSWGPPPTQITTTAVATQTTETTS